MFCSRGASIDDMATDLGTESVPGESVASTPTQSQPRLAVQDLKTLVSLVCR